MQSIKLGNLSIRTFKIAPHEIIPDPVVNDNSTWLNVEDFIAVLDDLIDKDNASEIPVMGYVDYKSGLMALADVLKVDFLGKNNTDVMHERIQKGQLNDNQL